MSGVLRRGSLNFNCNSNSNRKNNKHGNEVASQDCQPKTPEISVIALDFRRYSDDLKKNKKKQLNEESVDLEISKNTMVRDLSQDPDSDEISNILGHLSCWQIVWSIILSLFQAPPTFHIFAFTFQAVDKDFWCSSIDKNITDFKNLTNACLIPSSDLSENFTKCTSFEFENDGSGGKTLIEEFNLICDRKHLVSIVETCFLAGAAIGAVTSGWISDRYGRKHTLLGFAVVQTLFGTILAFSSSLAMYMTLRVIIGFASMTVCLVSFVLVVELVSGKWRTIIGILNILPMAISYVLAAGIAYLVRDWRKLQMVITLPWMALLFIWYCAPESPRWLLATGRLKELYQLLEKAARFNGQQLPDNYQKTLEAVASNSNNKTELNATDEQQQQQSSPKQPQNASIFTTTNNNHDNNKNIAISNVENQVTTASNMNVNPLFVVFNRIYCRTTVLNLIVWLTLILLYYGLTLHLSNLGGDIYVNTAIAGSLESISIVASIFIVLKVGIRPSLIAFMLIPGVCCLATNLIPEGDNNLFGIIALALVAKCVIGANNAIIPTYTAGQYPTEVRNFGVGLGNFAAGIALILVPYVWLLEHITPLLPLTVMGVCGLIGAVALCLMPRQ